MVTSRALSPLFYAFPHFLFPKLKYPERVVKFPEASPDAGLFPFGPAMMDAAVHLPKAEQGGFDQGKKNRGNLALYGEIDARMGAG